MNTTHHFGGSTFNAQLRSRAAVAAMTCPVCNGIVRLTQAEEDSGCYVWQYLQCGEVPPLPSAETRLTPPQD